MSAENAQKKEAGVLDKVMNIFMSPREAFESINQKPTWLVPLIILIVSLWIMQYFTMDIQFHDQMEIMRVRALQNPDAPQFDPSQGPQSGTVMTVMKVAPFVVAPIMMAIMFLILTGVFLLTGNSILGGDAKFKNVFSVVAWTSLVGALGVLVKMAFILAKDTVIGITTSPAILLKMPEIGKGAPILYRLLLRFDIFAVWQNILYIIGFSVIYKFSTKKSAIMVCSLWLIYILIVVFLNLDRFMGSPF